MSTSKSAVGAQAAPARAKKPAMPAMTEKPAATVTVVRAADLAKAQAPLTPMALHFATKENSRYVVGRRDWLRYLDTGITAASNGRMRATLSAANGAMTTETGWHYHTCEMQVGFVTKGWIELQYEDGTEIRLEAGDVMFVPGGVKHNELRTSDDIAGIEISIPADMGTVPCAAPEGWKPRKTGA